MTSLPGTRRLLTTWVILIGLTILSMISALLDADDWQTLPLGAAALVLLATGFKAQRVLMVYLNLRMATPAWKGAFVGLVILALAVISVGYLIARLA